MEQTRHSSWCFSLVVQRALLLCAVLLAFASASRADVETGRLKALETSYYQAVNLIYEGQFGVASNKFEELKSAAAGLGIENMPEFSFALLERTETMLESGDREKASFLLRRAEQLSPTDARVVFAVALFSELNGMSASTKMLFRAALLALGQPVVLGTVIANGLLLMLCAVTLACLLVTLVQITKHAEGVFDTVYRWLPQASRGVLGPPTVLALLVLPALGGVLFALSVWSIVLARSVKHCRGVAFMTAVLCMVWGLAIPLINTLGRNATAELSWNLDALHNHGYSPAALETVSHALQDSPKDPLLRFASAELLQLDGRLQEARAIYESLLREAPAVGSQARFQLGVLAFQEQSFAAAREAFEKLEKDGIFPFETAYNLALAHMSELNTEGHRKYYELAAEEDRSRAVRLEAETKTNPSPVLVGPPASLFPSFLLTARDGGAAALVTENRLAASMLRGARPIFLIAVGVAVFLIVLLGPKSVAVRKRAGEPGVVTRWLWRALPGGSQFADTAPARGGFLLGLFITGVIATAGVPVRLISAIPLGRTAGSWYFAATLLFALCCFGLSFLPGRRRDAEEEG